MKTIVLIRHAKTETDSASGKDFDRALTKRGINDAHEMGKRLKEKNMLPDQIIASPAMRTTQTSSLMADATAYDKNTVRYVDKLYHCNSQVFEDVITSLPDEANTVFIIAHNPGITIFANEIIPSLNLENVPTCGVVAACAETDEWGNFLHLTRSLLFFDFPKNN